MPLDNTETAQLQRDIVSVVTHDLGSIAGALALRAEIPGSTEAVAQERQRAVLKSLADQVRAAMRMLEVIRGGEGRSGLGAARTAPEGWWLEQLRRLCHATLPRGASVQCTASDAIAPLSERDVAGLTMLMLAALRHLQPERLTGALSLDIGVHVANDDRVPAVLVSMAMRGVPLRASRSRRTRWQRFCDAQSAERAWPVTWWHESAPDQLNWHCHLRLSAAD
ncbi:hypothetical protein GAU_0999 [Gemmatimonas aurantiaca T-27]|uniref:Uncharacterized protein n=1 Tax=Gemmatimonas aurantiaca (strain DSM 14586 / JCM 11422 / NBRC 100505 / T-27) TaxID=379066 RepID=C1A731_GEMAT|nr:hypothetical protein [Gemmatimonas aurantiaca]BAH38041.1 hypothetical protein GAU_0999 [Gemmatimonas aurantiaca T-27]